MILLNTQPIEKQQLRTDGAIEVVSIFYTLQGEGPFAGQPAVFVRLAGCNLKCPDCDTEYTKNRRWITPGQLVIEVAQVWHEKAGAILFKRTPLIVFTGGEPFRQDFGECVRALVASGFDRIQVETNGMLYVESFPYLAVTIICSPKTGVVNANLRPYIKCLKYVIAFDQVDERDGLPRTTLGGSCFIQKPWDGFKGQIFLQPADEKDVGLNENNQQICVALCLKFGYTLSYQIHKAVGLD